MSRRKKNSPTDFGPWMFLGADIESILDKADGPDMTASQLVATMIIAIEPDTLKIALREPKAKPLLDFYASGIATNPDLMTAIFQKVRSNPRGDS